VIDCNEWKTEKRHECANMGESKTTRIMMATVPHVTSGSGLRKFQADGLLFDRVYTILSLSVVRISKFEVGGCL